MKRRLFTKIAIFTTVVNMAILVNREQSPHHNLTPFFHISQRLGIIDMSENLSPISEAQEEQIKALFYREQWEEPTFRFSIVNDKYFIRVEQMYEYVLFKKPFTVLSGLLEIAKILGCENGDEYMRSHSDGCETCDYGSSYRVEWCFW